MDNRIEDIVGVMAGPSRVGKEWKKTEARKWIGAAIVLGLWIGMVFIGFSIPV